MPDARSDLPTITQRVQGSPVLRRRRTLGRLIGTALSQVRAVGLEGIPARGPVILAVNHRSALDGPVLLGLLERPITYLVKQEAFHPAPMAWLLRTAGSLPVRRGEADPAPLRLMLAVLAAGGVVGIFPEGSRGDGTASSARPGVGWLALRSGAPVLPIACHGTLALAHGRRFPRPPVDVAVGDLLAVTPWQRNGPLPRVRFLAETERIRAALAALVEASAPDNNVEGGRR